MNKILLTFILFFFTMNINAQEYFVNAESGLNVRETANLNSKRIGKLIHKEKVEILEKGTNKISIVDENKELYGFWFKIKSKNISGYVFSGFLTKDNFYEEIEIKEIENKTQDKKGVEKTKITSTTLNSNQRVKEKDSENKKEIQKVEKTSDISDLNQSPEQKVYRNLTDLKKYNGFEKISGQILGDSNSGITLAYIKKDSLNVLVLEEIIRTNSNKVNYSILDEVHLIFKSSDQSYVALTECDLLENPDDRIIFSLVENNKDNDISDKILKAWFIDLNENKFERIESTKIKCIDKWFGYDG